MRPVVRSLISPDEGADPIESYEPQDPSRFCLLVCATIGPDDGPGEELFDVMACSPLALAEQPRPEGFAFLNYRRAASLMTIRPTGQTIVENGASTGMVRIADATAAMATTAAMTG